MLITPSTSLTRLDLFLFLPGAIPSLRCTKKRDRVKSVQHPPVVWIDRHQTTSTTQWVRCCDFFSLERVKTFNPVPLHFGRSRIDPLLRERENIFRRSVERDRAGHHSISRLFCDFLLISFSHPAASARLPLGFIKRRFSQFPFAGQSFAIYFSREKESD